MVNRIEKHNLPLSNSSKVKMRGISGGISLGTVTHDPVFGKALFLKECPVSLLSVSQLVDSGWQVRYDQLTDVFTIEKGKNLLSFTRHHGLYQAKLELIRPHNLAEEEVPMIDASRSEFVNAVRARRLHSRLGHPSDARLSNMVDNDLVRNTKVTSTHIRLARRIFGKCRACVEGKLTRYPKPAKVREPALPGAELHVDIAHFRGEVQQSPLYLVAICRGSGYLVTKWIPNKTAPVLKKALSEIVDIFKGWGLITQRVFSDREAGLLTSDVNALGCLHFRTTAQGHDAFAERAIRHLRNTCRSIAAGLKYGMPAAAMPYLVSFATTCLNDRTNLHNEDESPRMILGGTAVDARLHLRASFGDVILCHSPYNTDSVSARAEWVYVLDRDPNSVGTFTVLNIRTKKIQNRLTFERVGIPDEVVQLVKEWVTSSPSLEFVQPILDPVGGEGQPTPHVDPPSIAPHPIPPTPAVPQDQQPTQTPPGFPPLAPPPVAENAPRRSGRVRNTPTTIQMDGKTYIPVKKGGLLQVERNAPFEDPEWDFFLSVGEGKAISKRKTYDAIDVELKQILQQNVLSPVKQEEINTTTTTILPSQMLLKFPRLEDGSPDPEKNARGRLVAGGHRQSRADYEKGETRGPTVRVESLMLAMGLAATEGMTLIGADIKGAYLNTPLPPGAQIFMRLTRETVQRLVLLRPDFVDFVEANKTMVVRLNKALYGLLESAKLWNDHLSSTLVKLGFKATFADQCVFYKGSGHSKIWVCVYVDDLLIATASSRERQKLIAGLESTYGKLKLNNSSEFVYRGLEIKHWEGKILVGQQKYIATLLADTNTIKTSKTPCAANFMNNVESAPCDRELYTELVARILWISTQTRPDCRFGIGQLCRKTQNPTESDFNKLTRILRYLNLTKHRGLCFKGESTQLNGWADASHLLHSNTKGHSGFIVRIGDNFVAAGSKEQTIHAQSSFEAELIATNSLLNLLTWCKYLVEELGFLQQPMPIYQDNEATVKGAKAGPISFKTKHIGLRYYNVANWVKRGLIELIKVDTADMLADLLTKPLAVTPFEKLRDKILGPKEQGGLFQGWWWLAENPVARTSIFKSIDSGMTDRFVEKGVLDNSCGSVRDSDTVERSQSGSICDRAVVE